MAQVYAVVYDSSGNFIVAKKNVFGYFFYKNGKRSIVEAGQKLNGAGSFCFPGGGLEGNDPAKGAIKEWDEETREGATLEKCKQAPQAYIGKGYYGIYFLAPDEIPLADFAATINKTLKEGEHIAQLIQQRTITKPDEISPLAPKDNELEHCQVVNIKDLGKYFIQGDKATGWFYDIVQDIKKKNNW